MPPLGALIRKRRIEFSSGIDPLDAVVCIKHGAQLQILGSPGAGKTTLALAYTAAVLTSGGRVAWISPRAFPWARLAATPSFDPAWHHSLEFYRPDLGQLLAVAPRVDLVVLEHYEHYVESREDVEAISDSLKGLNTASIITGTLCRHDETLRPFWGGLPFQTITLSRMSTFEVFARCGIHTFRLTAAPELQPQAPELIPTTLSEPESGSPWGLETPRKRRRVFLQGSPGEMRQLKSSGSIMATTQNMLGSDTLASTPLLGNTNSPT